MVCYLTFIRLKCYLWFLSFFQCVKTVLPRRNKLQKYKHSQILKMILSSSQWRCPKISSAVAWPGRPGAPCPSRSSVGSCASSSLKNEQSIGSSVQKLDVARGGLHWMMSVLRCLLNFDHPCCSLLLFSQQDQCQGNQDNWREGTNTHTLSSV